ncbi:MAG TPA: aconitase X, partial [Nitrososphaerales archaeon]|nr:aconitase X [Nitrososphaerales archaeon]
LSRMITGKHFRKKCYVFCSSKIYETAQTRGYAQVIEGAGGTFVRDACADFTPLISALNIDSVETDSCKGAHYMRKVHGVKISLKDTQTIIEENAV